MNVILGFHQKLLVEMDQIIRDWTPASEIGKQFAKFSPFLKMYTDYSEKYGENIKTFSRMERKNPQFKTAVDGCYAVFTHA